MNSPYDLLPIKRPLEDDMDYPRDYFYENVAKHLLKDVLKIQMNGISINLDKVIKLEKEIENTVNKMIEKVNNNEIIKLFLNKENEEEYNKKVLKLKNKRKTYKDFLVPFSVTNTMHRSCLINEYLRLKGEEFKTFIQEVWTFTDIKKLNKMIPSTFLENVINKRIENLDSLTVTSTNRKIAQKKADLFNQTKIEDKIKQLNKEIITSFNLNSSVQKQKLFEFLGVESESTTEKGGNKWDREELKNLLFKINESLKNKE